MGIREHLRIETITPKPLRLNIVLFTIVAVLLEVAAPFRGSSQVPISFERFSEQILKGRDVDHLVTYKSGDLLVVEVYLKKGSLNKSEYADAKNFKGEITLNGDKSAPQYFFTAANYDDLITVINHAETRLGYSDADRISVSIEAGHESLFSNWFVQCIVMIFLLITPIICGYWEYREGKKRTIGSTAGMLWGIFLGPFGLIIVHLTKKIPPQKNGGMRV